MEKDWKKTFEKDVLAKILEAKNEFDQYKLTNHSIFLQQAGNKLFSAVENYRRLKYDKRVKSYQTLYKLISHHAQDKKLLLDAVQLHYFFYNAQMQMENYEAEEYYTDVLSRLEHTRQIETV